MGREPPSHQRRVALAGVDVNVFISVFTVAVDDVFAVEGIVVVEWIVGPNTVSIEISCWTMSSSPETLTYDCARVGSINFCTVLRRFKIDLFQVFHVSKNNRLVGTMAVCVAGMLVIGLVMGTAVAQTQEQEPNDDFDTAQQVAEGDILAEIVDNESDFYQIEANATDALSLDLAERDGDVGVRLYGPDRSELASDAFGSDRSIIQKAPETGTYYVEVFSEEGQTTNTYTLNLQKITPAENDAYAPNDDFESAAVVKEGFHEATIWGGESDFYQIEANSTDAIDLDLHERNGDVGVRLYGPDRSELASDDGGSDRSITEKAPETGHY